MPYLLWIFFGVIVGILSGILGVGGGSIMIPFFVMALGMSQHQAHGTSLAAMLAPVAILAVWKYHQAGNVDVKVAVFVAIGIFAGCLLGGMWAQQIPDQMLRKFFGLFLLVLGIRMVFFK